VREVLRFIAFLTLDDTADMGWSSTRSKKSSAKEPPHPGPDGYAQQQRNEKVEWKWQLNEGRRSKPCRASLPCWYTTDIVTVTDHGPEEHQNPRTNRQGDSEDCCRSSHSCTLAAVHIGAVVSRDRCITLDQSCCRLVGEVILQ